MNKIKVNFSGEPYEILVSDSGEYKWIKKVTKIFGSYKLIRIASIGSLKIGEVSDRFWIELNAPSDNLRIYYTRGQQEQMLSELQLIEKILLGESL